MDKIAQDISNFVNEIVGAPVETVFVQLAVTLVMFLAVRLFLWNNVTSLIEARRNLIESEISEAKTKNLKATENKNLAEEKLANANVEAGKIIDKARTIATKEEARIVERAKFEASKKLEIADLEIQLQIEKSKADIKESIVDVAFSAAEKIVEKELDQAKHNEIIDDAIKRVGN